MDPRDGEAYLFSALAKEASGDLLGATSDGLAALAVDPGNPRVVATVSRLRIATKQPRAAIDLCDHALESDPRNSEFLPYRLKARLDVGDTDGAIADGRTLTELDAPSPEAWFVYAVALRNRADQRNKSGDAGGARGRGAERGAFERLLELEPQGERAAQVRGAPVEASQVTLFAGMNRLHRRSWV